MQNYDFADLYGRTPETLPDLIACILGTSCTAPSGITLTMLAAAAVMLALSVVFFLKMRFERAAGAFLVCIAVLWGMKIFH